MEGGSCVLLCGRRLVSRERVVGMLHPRRVFLLLRGERKELICGSGNVDGAEA